MNYLAPSILAADFCNLGKQIDQVEQAGAQLLHIDVMDGMFVPSISFGMPVLKSVRKHTNLFLDVHMMVQQPQRYIEEMIQLGADGITIHIEACDKVSETLTHIRELGARTGIAINPETPADAVLPFMDLVDMVLVMTVQPGAGGQPYIPESMDKIRTVRRFINAQFPNVQIQIDGGVRLGNLEQNLRAGANVIVTGSAVFEGDITDNVKQFLQLLKKEL